MPVLLGFVILSCTSMMLGCVALPLSLLAFLGSSLRSMRDGVSRTSYTTTSGDATIPVLDTAGETTLKTDLLQLATDTQRGFEATDAQRNQVGNLISQLQQLKSRSNAESSTILSQLEGSWTLVYTDAPDIINLRPQLPAFGELGRIGQCCQAPTISNVIEWVRPAWAATILPFTKQRILQKVVTEAAPNPSKPGFVTLQLSGFQVDTVDNVEDNGQGRRRPWLDVNGPLTVPFGEFQVLYLDKELRITQTGQGYIAVNIRTRPSERWF